MKIRVIAVGKIKEKYLKNLIDNYYKNINKKIHFEIIEIPDEKTPDKASMKENLKIKDIEGKKILDKIPNNSKVVSLDISGENIGIKGMKKIIERSKDFENLIFIIGGSLGISEKVLKESNLKISFSKMTFPHQLMRVLLLNELNKSI